ncbi:hypothetical protein SNE40_009552 [Patella caerulea]|uniref:Endonuclease/exonuclease/phosphatase domain-containing protein n=1 Tax=Patella caerulea TaxID=87958 RepID=A0AAN8JZ99_PATCE
MVIGDFNIHFDDVNNTERETIVNLLQSLSLSQFVNKQTHNRGHILDWIIARESDHIVKDLGVEDIQISDHFPVFCKLNVTHPERKTTYRNCRNVRKINREEFIKDLANSDLCTKTPDNATDFVNLYNSVLSTLFDSHAPLRSKKIAIKPPSPWYNDSIKVEKKLRRKLEKQWKRTGLEIHRQMFVKQRNKVNHMIRKSKTEYISNKVLDVETDARKLHCLTASLCNKSKESSRPDGQTAKQAATDMSTYFKEKIDNSLAANGIPDKSHIADKCEPEHTWVDIQPFTSEEVKKIIKTLPMKSCELDPIPTTLLLECLDTPIGPITKIINLSILTGSVPFSFKEATFELY